MDFESMAKYCLNCKTKPCMKACPLGNDIPEFISCIKQNNFEEAAKVLSKTTVLSPICSVICPHSKQCMGSCTRGIKGTPVNIGVLENSLGFLPYNYLKPAHEKTDKKVAVIGGGPAGLTGAAFLALNGVDVTIFEAKPYLGGLLIYGIPDFRLNKEIVNKVTEKIAELGISVQLNKKLGSNIFINDLIYKFDAIYLCFGANVPTFMNIDNINLSGVYGANSLLEYNSHPEYINKTVAIIGGGNVAMDMARTVKRKGAKKVYIIYRRSRNEMPAENEEIEAALSDDIEILEQTNIIKILGEKHVREIECIKTKLVKKENEIRLVPFNIEGSNFILDMDYVIMATGSMPDKNLLKELNLDLTENGYIKVNKNYVTSNNKIFAGGDLIGTKATVAWASRTGRDVAENILNYIKEN